MEVIFITNEESITVFPTVFSIMTKNYVLRSVIGYNKVEIRLLFLGNNRTLKDHYLIVLLHCTVVCFMVLYG